VDNLRQGARKVSFEVLPPVPPMHPRLDELRAYVDAQRSELLATASTLPPERWSECPAAGRWSITDPFEHLYRVEHGDARVIVKAPPRRAPPATPPRRRRESLRKLETSRAELHEELRQANGIAPGSVYQTHARLGELDLYRWILCIGEQEPVTLNRPRGSPGRSAPPRADRSWSLHTLSRRCPHDTPSVRRSLAARAGRRTPRRAKGV
jgi:hypothetical protein